LQRAGKVRLRFEDRQRLKRVPPQPALNALAEQPPGGLDSAGPYRGLLPDGVLERERKRHERTADEADAGRRERVRDDIARRIRRVCADLSEDKFRQLTEEMTDRQIEAERRVIQNFWRDRNVR